MEKISLQKMQKIEKSGQDKFEEEKQEDKKGDDQ